MTELEWLRQQLVRYTYRPGWTWEVVELPAPFSSAARFQIIARFKAMNAYPPHEEIEIKSQYAVPYFVVEYKDTEAFKRWFPHLVLNIEQHESREWLRRDGELVDDPHK